MPVIPTTFHGRYEAYPGQIVTAEGPLTNVTIRASSGAVTLRGLEIIGAELGTSRPAIVDASGADVFVEDCVLRGQPGQQAQGFYQNGGTLSVKRTKVLGVGVDRYFDHSFYLQNTSFLLEDVEAWAPAGGALHCYSGNARGVARRCEFRDSRWAVVAWGPGNDVTLEDCLLHGSRMVENGRGYGIESASGAVVKYKNCHLWDNEAAGNVPEHPGVNHNGGTTEDLGGNTFGPPDTPPPPPQGIVLRKVAEDAISYTLEWDPIPEIATAGFRFIEGDVPWMPHTWDSERNRVRVGKGLPSYTVEALGVVKAGTWKP